MGVQSLANQFIGYPVGAALVELVQHYAIRPTASSDHSSSTLYGQHPGDCDRAVYLGGATPDHQSLCPRPNGSNHCFHPTALVEVFSLNLGDPNRVGGDNRLSTLAHLIQG
jgi:hypothetical protein